MELSCSHASAAAAGPHNPQRGVRRVDFLRCMLQKRSNSSSATTRAKPMNHAPELEAEAYRFVCAVMHPEAHERWGYISMWQRDLRQRCWDYELPCPFWYDVIYSLDLELHVEATQSHHTILKTMVSTLVAQVEAFTRMLLEQRWPLEMLKAWQQRLCARTNDLWFPRRLWYDAVHGINLQAGPEHVMIALAVMRKAAEQHM